MAGTWRLVRAHRACSVCPLPPSHHPNDAATIPAMCPHSSEREAQAERSPPPCNHYPLPTSCRGEPAWACPSAEEVVARPTRRLGGLFPRVGSFLLSPYQTKPPEGQGASSTLPTGSHPEECAGPAALWALPSFPAQGSAGSQEAEGWEREHPPGPALHSAGSGCLKTPVPPGLESQLWHPGPPGLESQLWLPAPALGDSGPWGAHIRSDAAPVGGSPPSPSLRGTQ